MAGESVVKRRDRNQPFDFLRQVTARIALRSSNFSEQFGTTVDNSNNVFQIPAPGKIEQEQEADWFAAALLVPRDGLVKLRAARKTPAEIAAHFGVSEPLCQWRIHTTGVDTQLRRARR